MVKVKVNGQTYKVCTRWEDVKDADALLKCESFKDQLKALSTIPHAIIDNAPDLKLFPFYTLISFVEDLDLIPVIQALDVAAARYDDFENAKQSLEIGKPYQKFIAVARCYYKEESSVIKLLGLGVSIVQQMEEFLMNYQEMVSSKPTDAQINAGIEELSAFKSFGTVMGLAKGDITKMAAIYAMAANEVYTALYYSWKEARYQENLFNILHPKKPKG